MSVPPLLMAVAPLVIKELTGVILFALAVTGVGWLQFVNSIHARYRGVSYWVLLLAYPVIEVVVCTTLGVTSWMWVSRLV